MRSVVIVSFPPIVQIQKRFFKYIYTLNFVLLLFFEMLICELAQWLQMYPLKYYFGMTSIWPP